MVELYNIWSQQYYRNIKQKTVESDIKYQPSIYKNAFMYILNIYKFTKVVSSNPAHGEVYSIQHYVIKFVSDLQQVGGFLRVLQFPPPIKLTATI
jgi:hypothetical protein